MSSLFAPEVCVRQSIIRALLSVPSDTRMMDALRLMYRGNSASSLAEAGKSYQVLGGTNSNCIFVVDGSELKGIFTEGDVFRLNAEGRSLTEMTIAEGMTAPVIRIRESELISLSVPFTLMQQHQIHHLAVVDEQNALTGVITQDSLQPLLWTLLQEQQAVAETLRRSEAKHQSLIRALPDLIVRTSTEGIYLEHVPSSSFDSYCGDTFLVGRRLDECIPPDLAKKRLAYIQQAVQTGELQIYEQEILVNGELKIEEVRITVCGEDEVLVIIRDITDRKIAEATLHTSEATNRAMIHAIPDLLIRVNRQGEYLELLSGDSLKKVLKPTPEMKKVTVHDLLPNPLAIRRAEAIQQAFETGKLQVYEQQIELDGELRWEEVRVSLIDQDEVLVMVRDINDRKQAEVRLLQSEARNRAIVSAIPDLLVRVSAEGVYLDFVTPHCTFNLYPQPLNVIGQSITQLLPRDIAQQQILAIQRALETQELQVYEQQIQIGERLQYEEVRAIHFGDNEVLFMIRDISDRKQAEAALNQLNQELEARVTQRTAALRESEERWQLALRGSDASLWDWNLITHATFRTKKWRELRGLSEDEAGSSHEEWLERIHPEDRDRILAAVDNHLAQKTDFYQEEYRICRKDGTYIWVLDRAQALWDETGKPVRMIGSEVDITRRKEAELESQLLRERLQFMLSSSPAVIFTCQSGNGYMPTFISENIVNLSGFTAEELLSESDFWINHLHAEDLKQFISGMRTLFNNGQYIHEYRFLHKLGYYQWVRNELRLIRDQQGSPLEIIGYFADITDRKHAEEQLLQTNAELARATRLKDEFLANMSHELRTPLNAVLGMSEALQEGVFAPLTDRQKNAVEIIRRSGNHLLELINDILDLSKIEAGKLELQIAPVTVSHLCESSLNFVKQQAFHKEIRLTIDVSPHLPDIDIDERRIRQVLINLLSNAVKFTPEGGSAKLIAQIEPQDKKQVLCLSVVDTGIGIAQGDLDKLFQPFIQIDSRLNRQYAGTGLGLALVQKLVALHGGTVTVTSALHQGSCFTIRLPYQTAIVHETALLPTNSTNTLTPVNGRVLVIEDSIAASEQLSRYLHEVNMQTLVHAQGEGAVEKAAQIQPSLIILDILLPNLSGWDVLKQLKSNPQTQSIPVIVISVVDERSRGLALGANEYLVKPITRTQLRTVLEHLNFSVDASLPATSSRKSSDVIGEPVLPPLILLAEDNEMNIVTLSSYLDGLEYRLIYAKNGKDAIDQTELHAPDLILMDIQMPEMDGLEAIRKIRRNPRFTHLPIIALTALAMTGDRERCMEAGADYYLPKPVKLKELQELLQKVISQPSSNR